MPAKRSSPSTTCSPRASPLPICATPRRCSTNFPHEARAAALRCRLQGAVRRAGARARYVVAPALIAHPLALSSAAPSVGLAQPWRFVLVETQARRTAIRENFAAANKAALDGYAGERQARYARLKLGGVA